MTRTILVHLNVGIADGDTRTADEIADRVIEALSDLTDLAIVAVSVPLAEEIES